MGRHLITEIEFENILNAVADYLDSEGDNQISKAITLSIMFGVNFDSLLNTTRQIKRQYSGPTNDATIDLVNWLESKS